MKNKIILLQKQCRTYLWLALQFPLYKKQAKKCLDTARKIWDDDNRKREEVTTEIDNGIMKVKEVA